MNHMNNFWLKLKKKKQAILALAPMAGITDSAFRQMCKKYGADVVYTEMVSADGLHYDSKKTLEFLRFDKAERPVVIQLFGKHPEKFVKAAKLAEKAGFDGIDINFGCPAKKVAGHGGGVTLMRDLKKCREIIESVMAGSNLPVSVKLRSSINKEGGKVTAFQFLHEMKDLPIAAVMIHGRPYENPFNAPLDYEMIHKCVEFCRENMPRTIVLGNGGIMKPEDAKKMIDESDVDGVGLARELYGKPWLFKQCRDYLKTGKYKELTMAEIKKTMIDHAKSAIKDKDAHGIVELRKHLIWYASGWPGAKELRIKLVKVENVKDVKEALK